MLVFFYVFFFNLPLSMMVCHILSNKRWPNSLGVGWWVQASWNKQNPKAFTHYAMRVNCRKTTQLQTLSGAICFFAEAAGSHLGGTVSAFIVLQLVSHDIPIIDKKNHRQNITCFEGRGMCLFRWHTLNSYQR